MARKLTLSTYDKQHLKNLLRQAQTLRDIFGSATDKAVTIGAASGFCDPEGEFLFDKFPAIKERVRKLFDGLHDQLTTAITEGNRREWLLSEAKNDEMVERLCKRAGISADRAAEWMQPNMAALDAFQGRKERGMGLSDRVWRLTDQFKGELEMALELGLGDGKSATDLSRDVREYLNEPHKLFRRVRNEKGQLRLSKSAAAYHPGQGVYRSSYKNALRLTATENNMAYRTADHERWQQLDFVIGIEILLSNNHPCEDICDELAGVYPKTFKFVGWHPFCRCIAVPKLADEDEFIERQQALIDGKDVPEGGYSGEITEMPEAFNNWVQYNAERIENAANVPYFIRDNAAPVKAALHPTPPATRVKHVRTDDEAEQLQTIWNNRRMRNFRDQQDRYDLTSEQKDKINEFFDKLSDANFLDPRGEFKELFKELDGYFVEIHKAQTTTLSNTSVAQQTRWTEFGTDLGIKRGVRMTTKEADLQSANPNYHKDSESQINCQTCVPTYMARLQGYDVTAKPCSPGSLSEYLSKNALDPKKPGQYHMNCFEAWECTDGKAALPLTIGDWAAGQGLSKMTWEHTKKMMEENTTQPGIYQFVCAWRGGGAHTTIIQRFDDGTLARIEPQVFNGSMKRGVDDLCKMVRTQINGNWFGGLMRIDDKMLAKKFFSIFNI